MKVLLINGSPNKNGCVFTALSEITAVLEQEGIETEILQMGSQPIRGCIDCQKCKKPEGMGSCVFTDDLVNVFIQKMEEADGLIVGSPVYFASANGNLISLLDRAFRAGRKESFAHKPGAVVASARRAGTTATLDQLSKYFTICQMPLVSSTYWNMVHGYTPEEVRQDKEGLQVMQNLGRNMAWLLKCIKAGKEQGIAPPAAEPIIRTNFIR